jgi:predicted NBD/HSP70 family sugar kinase
VASLPSSMAQGNSAPPQLIHHASLWELEQRLATKGLDPLGAYDERAFSGAFEPETRAWVRQAADALAHAVVSGTAFLDIDAVVIDGSFCRPLLTLLIEETRQALQHYNWEGLWQANVIAGEVGPDARALGGALMPLHANFAPDQDLFLKTGA